MLTTPYPQPAKTPVVITSIFAVMFGYSVSPEWGRIVVHFTYLMVMLPLMVWLHKKKEDKMLELSSSIA
ncbi:MAG: hypothetical protein QW161_05495 [Candidatus Bathyarchaeia archaeon]